MHPNYQIIRFQWLLFLGHGRWRKMMCDVMVMGVLWRLKVSGAMALTASRRLPLWGSLRV